MATKILTAERLREILNYDPATGVFTQNQRRRGSGKPAGAVAGWRMKIGYTAMCVDGRQHFAHRLAFIWMNGTWPAHDVDHINGDKADNRWDNLRDVRKDTNLQNMRKPTKFNTAGLLGASWDKLCGKWRAQIRIDGRTTYIGSYKTAKEAHEAYVEKKRIHHPGCTI